MQHPYTLVLLFTLAAVLVPLTPAGGAADRKGESSAEQPAEESVPAKTEKNTASKTKPIGITSSKNYELQISYSGSCEKNSHR